MEFHDGPMDSWKVKSTGSLHAKHKAFLKMFWSTDSAHVAHDVAAGYIHAAGHIDCNIT